MSSESTRITLIRCMRKLIRINHFSQISITDICDSAHISRRSFYRYFSDKYALLQATYVECFFSKIKIEEDDIFWDVFLKVCIQIFPEKQFFLHAFEVKDQNGFWDEMRSLLTPYMKRDYPSTDETHKMCDFFIENDLNMLFLLIEDWIHEGMEISPEEFADFVRTSFAVYGKWVYEVATYRPRSHYTITKFKKNEW